MQDAEPDAPRRRRRQPAGTPPLAVAGRAVLALVPLMWLTSLVTRPWWADAPVVDGLPGHPVVAVFLLVSLTVGLLSPFLLLPVGDALDARVADDGTCTVPTVLGTRRVDLTRLDRVGALTAHLDASTTSYLLLLRSGRRWVVLYLGTGRHVPREVRRYVDRAVADDPSVVSARARHVLGVAPRPGLVHRVALGAVTAVLGVPLYAGVALLLGVLVAMVAVPFSFA